MHYHITKNSQLNVKHKKGRYLYDFPNKTNTCKSNNKIPLEINMFPFFLARQLPIVAPCGYVELHVKARPAETSVHETSRIVAEKIMRKTFELYDKDKGKNVLQTLMFVETEVEHEVVWTVCNGSEWGCCHGDGVGCLPVSEGVY